jgi:glycosyltransferase involved in cell wall biosynthesis
MPTIAYLANIFPSPVEPYVFEEVRELRRRGIEVVPCSARLPQFESLSGELQSLARETLYLGRVQWREIPKALWMLLRRLRELRCFWTRALFSGTESPRRRLRTLVHTCLGIYLAVQLRPCRVEHIHVHHGYFSSWIAMVAAHLLGIEFSMTLHGSDLLLHPAYLDLKLERCSFCLTVSEFNKRHLLAKYRSIAPEKILVHRLGVDLPTVMAIPVERKADSLVLLAVGRLHAVKDHAFLVRACKILRDMGIRFHCLIAGEGPERPALEQLIADLELGEEVKLLGHVERSRLADYYAKADLVVLTSRSEGVPLVLMEAMAHGKLVLAPAITGIPELVIDGKTGFLFEPGSLDDFVSRIEEIISSSFPEIRRAARRHVRRNFHRESNLISFGDLFSQRLAAPRSGARS